MSDPKKGKAVEGIGFATLERVLTFLPRQRFRFLVRRFGIKPAGVVGGTSFVGHRDVLTLAVFDWFAHLGEYVTDDQQQRVVDRFAPQLDNAVLAGDMANPIRGRVLTLSDGRYAAVTGRAAWYDYELDEDRETLSEPSVTHIACDLVALQMRVRRRAAELSGGTDAAAQRGNGPSGRPPVGDRSAE